MSDNKDGARFEQTLFIAAPAERVWEAITSPNWVEKYHLCPLKSLDLQRGGSIVYGTGDETLLTGVVIDVEPERKLSHTFRFITPAHPGVESDGDSRVTYLIEPMCAMCRLTLVHDRLASGSQAHANIVGGWPVVLSGLKTVLETGAPLPWPPQNDR